MIETTEPPGNGIRQLPVSLMGWHVKVDLKPLPGGFALVAKCSCGQFDDSRRGKHAWDTLSGNIGAHIRELHLARLNGLA